MGGQKGPFFYIYHERITGYRSKWKFLLKVVSFYPSISPFTMKGYVTASGYMGYVENEYILFASEDDYFDYMEAI